jgi:hypothetical protein
VVSVLNSPLSSSRVILLEKTWERLMLRIVHFKCGGTFRTHFNSELISQPILHCSLCDLLVRNIKYITFIFVPMCKKI